MKISFELEDEKARLLLRALRREDGHSLAFDLPFEQQRELTEVLDVLRSALHQEEK